MPNTQRRSDRWWVRAIAAVAAVSLHIGAITGPVLGMASAAPRDRPSVVAAASDACLDGSGTAPVSVRQMRRHLARALGVLQGINDRIAAGFDQVPMATIDEQLLPMAELRDWAAAERSWADCHLTAARHIRYPALRGWVTTVGALQAVTKRVVDTRGSDPDEVRSAMELLAQLLIEHAARLEDEVGVRADPPPMPEPTMWPSPRPTATPGSTTPPTSTAPSEDCPAGRDGHAVDDRRNGIHLTLPAHWRDLRPGDDGWLSIYGEHGTPTEQDVASGSIADFAVPLVPRDDDLTVNLTVYVEGIGYDTTLELAAASYGFMLTRIETPARTIRHEELSLPAGAAVRITADMPPVREEAYPGSLADYRLVVYVLIHRGRAWYLSFSSATSTADSYSASFRCIAGSLRFADAPSSPMPDGVAVVAARR